METVTAAKVIHSIVTPFAAAEPKLEPKLDRFLINHQASSPVSGIKGLLPYATVVGYESGR
jgi:hypothetical protein